MTASLRGKSSYVSQIDDYPFESHAFDSQGKDKSDDIQGLNNLERLSDLDHVNGFLSHTGSNGTSDTQWSDYDYEDAQDQVFSPPLLMDSTLLEDSFEDLLGMLSLHCSVLVIVSRLSMFLISDVIMLLFNALLVSYAKPKKE